MTVTGLEHIPGENKTDTDSAAYFNELMSRTEGLLAVVDGIRALNPAFVVKLYAVIEGARKSRLEANAQHSAIAEALIDVFPEDDQRLATTNWFVYLAMAFGYSHAQRTLASFVAASGNPMVVPRLAPPAPQLHEAFVPGFSIGPWRSPARGRANKAVTSMGNPHGAGRVFKAALETFSRTRSVLASSIDIDPVATGLVKTAMEEPAIEIFFDGDGDALLSMEISRDDPEDYGCSVVIELVESWCEQIRSLMKDRKALSGSVKYWAPTLEKMGLDPSTYDD
jgi:hypothetical protein